MLRKKQLEPKKGFQLFLFIHILFIKNQIQLSPKEIKNISFPKGKGLFTFLLGCPLFLLVFIHKTNSLQNQELIRTDDAVSRGMFADICHLLFFIITVDA